MYIYGSRVFVNMMYSVCIMYRFGRPQIDLETEFNLAY